MTRLSLALMLFALAPRMDAQRRGLAGSAGVGLDHVILGVDDLDRGVAEFARRTGVTPVKGGVHPGRGTQNALVSLGSGVYLEILAPSHEAGTTPDSSTMHQTLTPVGWALHTTNIGAAVDGLRNGGTVMSGIRPGARARPDGVQLSWQTAAPTDTALRAAPFLIQWGAGTPHPSTQSPTGCTLRSVSVADPSAEAMRRFLTSAEVQVAVAPAATRTMTVVLDCPRGTIEFR